MLLSTANFHRPALVTHSTTSTSCREAYAPKANSLRMKRCAPRLINRKSGRTITVAKVAPPSLRAERKADLLSAIKGLKRGVDADEEDRDIVDNAARRCEEINPTKDPLSSDLVNGQWRLVYTTSDAILGSSRPPPLRPSGPIFQYIDTSKMQARNTETWPFFNQVAADLTATSSSEVFVQFVQFKIFGLLPVKAPASATGSLDTTYLDSDMRISRGDKGNLFVLLLETPGCLL